MSSSYVVRPVSKAFYLCGHLGFSLLGIILIVALVVAAIGFAAAEEHGQLPAHAGPAFAGVMIVVVLLMVASLIVSAVFLYVLYYKMWAAIQDGHARTTPGQAVGFLFIPLFNIYWIFQALWGFSKDYNAFIHRHSIPVKPLSENLFLWACITPFLGYIPYVGGLAGIATLVLYILVIIAVCDAINALVHSQPQLSAPVTTQWPQDAPNQSPMQHDNM